jgi:hypothetical protein
MKIDIKTSQLYLMSLKVGETHMPNIKEELSGLGYNQNQHTI